MSKPMFEYKCVECGAARYTTELFDQVKEKSCSLCGGAFVRSPGFDSRKMTVHIGTSVYEVREGDVIEQVCRNHQRKGIVHAITFYRHLRPDISSEEAKAAVEQWCADLPEGGIAHV